MDWGTVAKELKRSFKDYRERTDCAEDDNGVNETDALHNVHTQVCTHVHTHMHTHIRTHARTCCVHMESTPAGTAGVKGTISRAPQGNVLECLNLTSNGESCLHWGSTGGVDPLAVWIHWRCGSTGGVDPLAVWIHWRCRIHWWCGSTGGVRSTGWCRSTGGVDVAVLGGQLLCCSYTLVLQLSALLL